MHERVLVLSCWIPPAVSGSAIIVGNLATQFARAEMVVAGERPVGQPAMAWRTDWPERVYVTVGWPPTLRGARWWRRLQFPALVARCVWLAWRRRCTAVLAVFPRGEYLLAAYLTARWLRLDLFPYFHNTYVENYTGLRARIARWVQSRVFARAKHVFVMSEGMLELYRERYPGLRCSALPHSFAEDIPAFSPPPEPRSPLRITLCGTINESCREATVRICEALSQVANVAPTVLSGTPRAVLKKLGVLRNGIRHETVSRDHLLSRLRESDIVVLAHGLRGSIPPEEYRTIFPTRTIEYLICGRPILAHAPADCFLSRLLRLHDCALLVDQADVAALVAAIERLRSDAPLRARLVRNALRAAAMFHAPRVASLLRAQLHAHASLSAAQAQDVLAEARR
jgi:glycosyltransferase involved in cell wall biosynthesis